ncbi:Acyl-CoA thioesterase [Geosmithia morbida]|uniref:Acyl-CoA thioesterase n=1 Tax=Geosmithia morbida TaxID=1094350 RepID=A0A9P4Z0P9_9HYPO|nr:Acyl-CoA thioesterase [Geosmithia morbida]KAF4124484.1 Acyl-CoA thioesterase [Geosmithia morbida]
MSIYDSAPIENTLEVTELAVLGPDLFTNTRQPWLPHGARGIYGGAVIAQSLASAQKTVPEGFLPHSCHCYFLLAGSASVPILFHVERVRDGRSFATRTVQARQRGRCIFTTTISFARDEGESDDDESNDEGGKAGRQVVRHAAPMPEGVAATRPPDDLVDGLSGGGPVQNTDVEVVRRDDDAACPHERVSRTWMRARGKISPEGGIQAHLNALAYMSDSYFIGTVSRAHRLWRFIAVPAEASGSLTDSEGRLLRREMRKEGMGDDPVRWQGRPAVGMIVSLDHSIYFHEPRRVMADQWMFCEMETPWSGQQRGVVSQRIFAADGTLLASCYQEGVIRLRQDGKEKSAKL